MEDEEEGQSGWNGTHSTEGISRDDDFSIVDAYLMAIGMTKTDAGGCEAGTSACEGETSACEGEVSACEDDGGTLTGWDEDVVGGKRRKT